MISYGDDDYMKMLDYRCKISVQPKPCPFCGDVPVSFTDYQRQNQRLDGTFKTSLRCEHCQATTHIFSRREDAVHAWNKEEIFIYSRPRPGLARGDLYYRFARNIIGDSDA